MSRNPNDRAKTIANGPTKHHDAIFNFHYVKDPSWFSLFKSYHTSLRFENVMIPSQM